MNFLAQLGVLAVILIILVIIIKSNKELEKIYMEADGREEQAPPEIKIPEFEIPKIKAPKVEMPKWSFGKKSSKTEREEEDFGSFAEEKKEQRMVSETPARSQATVPMEGTGKGVSLFIEVLDERGRTEDTIKVQEFPYTIGRNEENDLVLDDLSVSGFHARLEEEDGRIVLYDQGSLNKLMISGRQETKVPVNGEVEVGLGNTNLRFIKEVKRSSQTLYYAGTSLMEEWH